MLNALLMLEANGYTSGGDVYDDLAINAVQLAGKALIDLAQFDQPKYLKEFIV